MQTSSEIQGAARRRQRSQLAGEANAAASLDSDLTTLYPRLSDGKRDAAKTGVVANGLPYAGRTWRAE